MEDVKFIGLCNYCGETKEVIKTTDDRNICADCAIDMQDRIEGHYLSANKNSYNVKNKSCQNVAAVTER